LNPRLLILIGLALAVFASALGNVYVKHLRRTLVVELDGLQGERDEMQIEWGQLRLEESTWATHDRVQELAGSRLGLALPANDATVLVTP